MKDQTLLRMLNRLTLLLFVITASLIAACSDDPESTNEEEVITTVLVALDPEEAAGEDEGEIITLSWDDVNLDAIVDASEVIVSGPLFTDKTYDATIQILNKSGDSEIDISQEIEEEAEEHIFCFAVSDAGISITIQDEDKNGLPLGLKSIWSTTSLESTGTVTLTLRHQPGVKTGDCPGAGETDATLTFPVAVTFGGE
jgi:hypothetical protein